MSRRKHNREPLIRPRRSWIVIGALLAGAATLPAGSVSAQEAEAVLRLANAAWRVQEWPEATLPTREVIRDQIGKADYTRLAFEHQAHFERGELLLRLRAEIDRNLPAFQQAIAFYAKTPGSLLVAEREIALTRPELNQQAVFLAQKFAGGGSSSRIQVIRRVDEATHLSSDLLRVARASVGALAMGAARVACLPRSEGPAQRRQAVATLVRMEGPLRSRAQLMLEFAHRERDTLDLAREAQAGEASLRPAFAAFSRALERVLRAAERQFLSRVDALAAESCGGPGPA